MPKRREYRPEPWQTPANAAKYLRYLILNLKEKHGRWPSPSVLMAATHRWPKQIMDEALLQLRVDEEVEIRMPTVETGGYYKHVTPTDKFRHDLAGIADGVGLLRNPDEMLESEKQIILTLVQQIEKTHAHLIDPCEGSWPCSALALAKQTRELIRE